jgi:hypothetical protein
VADKSTASENPVHNQSVIKGTEIDTRVGVVCVSKSLKQVCIIASEMKLLSVNINCAKWKGICRTTVLGYFPMSSHDASCLPSVP